MGKIESFLMMTRWFIEPEDTSTSQKPQLWHLRKINEPPPNLKHRIKSMICFVAAIAIGFLTAEL